MNLSALKKAMLLLVAVVFTAGTAVFAQEEVTLKQATETYNSGATVINEDPAKALEYFEKCMAMCDEIGEESDDLRLKAERPLASLYYKVAMDQYQDGEYIEALANFEKAYDIALLIEDETTEKRAWSRIPMVYLGIGNQNLKDGNSEEAIKNYEKVLELDKRNERAFFYLASAYTQLGNFEKVFENYDNAIKFDQTGPKKIAKNSSKRATNILLKQGQNAYKEKQWDVAIEKFEKSFVYSPEDVMVAYLIAEANFKNGNNTEAIAAAERTLEWEKGGDVAKAKVYFLLGQIYQKMNNVDKACEAYKSAAYGEFKPNADYRMLHVLKCK